MFGGGGGQGVGHGGLRIPSGRVRRWVGAACLTTHPLAHYLPWLCRARELGFAVVAVEHGWCVLVCGVQPLLALYS